jgi:hypothetical protein
MTAVNLGVLCWFGSPLAVGPSVRSESIGFKLSAGNWSVSATTHELDHNGL